MSAQAEFLNVLIQHYLNRPLIGIEVGTASGIWTQYMLKNGYIDHLYTIDPYKHFPGEAYEGGRPPEWHDKIKASADKKLNAAENLTRLEMTSEEAYDWFVLKNIEADFVYIDGNHNEEYIKYDIWHYWNLVNDIGILAGHDYNLKQVRKAVEDFFGPKHNVIQSERVWWVQKSKNIKTGNLLTT